MSRLDPEESVLDFSQDNFIYYCPSCCAMEYQPHCKACMNNDYKYKISVFDNDLIDILLDSYYSCLVVYNMGD
jgi:hypothetical protein